MPPTKLKILITGAGIGGSALAFWLSKLQHNVTVIERHPCLRVNGLQLDLRGYGIEVMKLMGLEQIVRSKLVAEEGVALVDNTGRRRAFFAANKSGKGAQSFSSEYEIMRRDLCQILHDAAVKQGATYVFGTYVESLDERNNIVNVKFADGKTDTYDLVVGADGLSSRLRRLIFTGSNNNDQKDSLVNLPERTAYFTIPKPIAPGEQYVATAYLMPHKSFVLTRRHSPTEMQVYLSCDTASKPPSTSTSSTTASPLIKTMTKFNTASEKAAFTELFQNGGWKADEFVKALNEGAEDWYVQYAGFVKMDHWSQGHVTLVGDAAHGAPADGMGTSAALVGAYVLAGEIERHHGRGDGGALATTKEALAKEGVASTNKPYSDSNDSILTALASYESTFHPYITHIHANLSSEPNIFEKIPWTPLTVEVVLWLAWIFSVLKIDRLLSRMMPIENSGGWKLPRYEMAVDV